MAKRQNTPELSRRALLCEALMEKFICQSVEGRNGIQVEHLDIWAASVKEYNNEMWMRSSRVVRVSGCQCQSRKDSGFAPSILRHSGILGAADEAVLTLTYIKRKNPKNPTLE